MRRNGGVEMRKRKPKWTPARLIALRERLGLTQREFAARLSNSMSNQAVSRWEAGRGHPSPLYVDRLGEIERSEAARESAEREAREKGEGT